MIVGNDVPTMVWSRAARKRVSIREPRMLVRTHPRRRGAPSCGALDAFGSDEGTFAIEPLSLYFPMVYTFPSRCKAVTSFQGHHDGS